MGLLPAARLNEQSDHGGHIITASDNTTADGIQLARDQDLHSCPLEGHGITPVTATTKTVFVNSLAALRVNDRAGCGAAIIGGSPTVNVGD